MSQYTYASFNTINASLNKQPQGPFWVGLEWPEGQLLNSKIIKAGEHNDAKIHYFFIRFWFECQINK